MKHALLIHSLFLLTPGIPRLFMGLFNYTKQLLTFRYQYSVSERSAIDD